MKIGKKAESCDPTGWLSELVGRRENVRNSILQLSNLIIIK